MKFQDNVPVQKFARRRSFFNFFSPPQSEGGENSALMDAHLSLGILIKEQLVPKATHLFMGEHYQSQSHLTMTSSKVQKWKKKRKAETSVDEKKVINYN